MVEYVALANLKGPQGDVTPAALDALADAREARDDAQTARQGAETARDAAEVFAGQAEGLQDEAVAGVLGAGNAATAAAGAVARDEAAAAFLSAPHVDAPLAAFRQATRGGQIRVVGLGSSTMAGGGVQAGLGVFERLGHRVGGSQVSTIDSPVTGARMFVNGAISGSTSADFLPTSHVTTIGTINPTHVLIMIGSNDAATGGVTTAQYQANLRDAADAIRGAAAGATLIFIHQQGRASVPATTWDTFRNAMRTVAGEYDNAVFIDVSDLSNPLSMHSQNALGLIGSDNIHLTTAGHRWLADMLAVKLGLPQVPDIKETRSVVTTESTWAEDRTAASLTLPAVGYPRLVRVGGQLFLERMSGTARPDVRISYLGTYASYRVPLQEGGGSIPLSVEFVVPPGTPCTVSADVVTNGASTRVSGLSTYSRMIVTSEVY